MPGGPTRLWTTLPRPGNFSIVSRMARLGRLLAPVGILAWLGCGGAQEGYYGPCDEPGGLVLGCESRDPDAFTPWDACAKLATCGVILAGDDQDDDTSMFDECIDQLYDAAEAQGFTVLACIEESACPDLARTDPDSIGGADPNPSNGNIEGVIGYCGRLDP